MSEYEFLCPMVKSSNFEDLFRKQRLNQSQQEIEDITSDLIDLDLNNEDACKNIEDKVKVVKMLDFVISCAETTGMSGSELFSMILNKEKVIKMVENG